MAEIRDAAFEGGWRMSDLLKKLNEMGARLSASLKELRKAIEKEEAPNDEIILGGMFEIKTTVVSPFLIDKNGDKMELYIEQADQLRAIENIIQTAYKRTIGSSELYDAFKEAEKLDLKF